MTSRTILLMTAAIFTGIVAFVMISNERPSPFQPRRPKLSQHQFPPRPPVEEKTLHTEQVQVERKTFVFRLKENPRGRFVRIIEEGGRNSNSIILPYSGLKDFLGALAKTVEAANQLPPENPPQ